MKSFKKQYIQETLGFTTKELFDKLNLNNPHQRKHIKFLQKGYTLTLGNKTIDIETYQTYYEALTKLNCIVKRQYRLTERTQINFKQQSVKEICRIINNARSNRTRM